jgi:hypothetical protein
LRVGPENRAECAGAAVAGACLGDGVIGRGTGFALNGQDETAIAKAGPMTSWIFDKPRKFARAAQAATAARRDARHGPRAERPAMRPWGGFAGFAYGAPAWLGRLHGTQR